MPTKKQISIRVRPDLVEISLKDGRKITDRSSFAEHMNLSERLLVEIDGLLARNKLTAQDLSGVKVRSEIPQSYTSTRIAKAVEKAFNYALKA